MKTAIIGSPQSGQQQLFSLLTKINLEGILSRLTETHIGACDVKDPRIEVLTKMYSPKKVTYTKIEYLLLPDFNAQGPTKNLILNQLKNADEICWVSHAENAKADIANFLAEMILADLMLIEKRLETISKDKSGKNADQKDKEKTLMDICKKQLDQEKPLKDFTWDDEQKKLLKAYQFYTLKPIFIVINVPEDKIKDSSLISEIQKSVPYPCIQLSVEIEKEIDQLPETEQKEFMKEIGIDEPAVNKMNQMTYEGLGLISFFTVGEDEVRAWPVRRGAMAPEAGASIHTDIEKGFVKVEMFKYDDLIALGTETKLKESGKFYLKGKDYIVEDGDILNFRFNV